MQNHLSALTKPQESPECIFSFNSNNVEAQMLFLHLKRHFIKQQILNFITQKNLSINSYIRIMFKYIHSESYAFNHKFIYFINLLFLDSCVFSSIFLYFPKQICTLESINQKTNNKNQPQTVFLQEMAKRLKNFVCTFEASHKVDSEQKLISHMKKCKAQQKQSYGCCKFNPLHWVKYDLIKQHEQKCPDQIQKQKESFEKMLPNQISRIQFQIPFQIDVSMIGNTKMKTQSLQIKDQPQKGQHKDMKKKSKKLDQVQKKVQLWREPDFLQFLQKRGYKKSKRQRIFQNQNDILLNNNNSFRF